MWLWRVVSFGGLLLAGLQCINLFVSTAQVENKSERPLTRVAVLVDEASVELGDFPPGETRFVFLPRRGDATFRIRFSAGGGEFTQCSEYVEESTYHVYVAVGPDLAADCRAQVRMLSRKFVALEMVR